jgi:alkylhydroperoxidase/carboxymuconolactone decarboxylase family protein YurZ
MQVAWAVVLTAEQRATREQWARGRSLPARQVEWSRIVLLAAEGQRDIDIAVKLRITRMGLRATVKMATAKRVRGLSDK